MRPNDWPEKLHNYIEQCQTKKFKWGEHDCALFAAKAIYAITGVEMGKKYWRKYRSKTGAARLIKKHGSLPGLIDSILAKYGLQRQLIQKTQRGDIVAKELENGTTAGVCLGLYSAFPAAIGLVYYKTVTCQYSWGVK